MSSHESIATHEKRALPRMTRQRRVILDELRATTSHPTADELHARVRGQLPHVSLGTVYRNLDVMVKKGVIRKLELGGSQCRYDGRMMPHDHVRCVGCGCVADVPSPGQAVDISAVQGPPGFRLLGHRLEFLGECPQCQTCS
jgi:Fur family transcriptional regulator, ferric uptake regulator